MGIRFWFENYTRMGVDMGGGGSGAAAGGRGKSSASVKPNPHCVWPSGVERTMHRQRERASVRTETRPVITTGVSSIYVLDRNIPDPKSLHVPFYCCSTSIAWFGMHTIRNSVSCRFLIGIPCNSSAIPSQCAQGCSRVLKLKGAHFPRLSPPGIEY